MALRAAYPGPRLKRGFFPVALLVRVPRPQAEAELFPVAFLLHLAVALPWRRLVGPRVGVARSSKSGGGLRTTADKSARMKASGLLVMAQRELQQMALDQPLASNLQPATRNLQPVTL